MIGKIYPSWIEYTTDGSHDYATGSFIALLLTGNYSYNSSHAYISDLDPFDNELPTALAYARTVPSNLSVVRSGSTTAVSFDPVVFSLVTATAADAPRYMVLAKAVIDDDTSPLVLVQDFETSVDLVNEDLTIIPSAAGFIRYVAS